MKFDDIRKKYLDDSIKDEKKETKTESNSSPKRTSSFDDIRKKYGIGNESVSVDYDKGREGWQKYLADNSKPKEDKTPSWVDIIIRGFTTASDNPVNQTFNNVVYDNRNDDSYTKPNDDWKAEHRYKFGELYLSDPEAAFKYAAEVNNNTNKEAEEEAIKKIQDSATDNFWSGAAHTAGAIATAPFGLADFLDDLAKSVAGKPITSDGFVSPFEYSQAVTGGISEHLNEEYGVIDESIPIIGGKGWGDVYGLGTSIAQSAASAYTLGGAGTLVSYFGQGAASGVDDALSRGASEEQAILYGTSLGVFEGLAEMIGVDNLFKIGSSSTVKGLIKNILKQAGAEGVEEGITSVLDNIADAWIMQDKSNFNIQLNQYISQGMSESEAKWKVFLDSIEGIAFDTIAGAVSGGVHGGVATSIQTGISNHYASKFYGDQSQTLVDEALGSQFSDAKAVGQKFKDKLDSGKKLSGWNLNELLEVTDNSKLKSAVLQRLGELGETSDVTAVADVIIRQAMGEELSSKDVNILNNSKAGHTVLAEMNKDNIKSGGLANKWAENIGTRRVNPEAYNKDVYEVAQKVSAMREAQAKNSVAKTIAETEQSIEGKNKVSESGKTVYTDENGDGHEVNIKRVVSTDGGIKVELDNGKTVSTSELSFGTQAEAIMYEMVARMEVTPDTANEIIKTFKPKDIKQASLYFSNVALAYEYGKYGYEAGLKNIDLSKAEKRIAYNRGRADAIQSDKSKAKSTTQKGTDKASTKKNGIIFEDGFVYDEATANEMQKKGMIGAEVIDKMSSLEVHIYASELQADGTRVANVNGKRVSAPNGYFKDGNKIYIDFYAGDGGEGAMLYTMSHEITHYIREWNAKGFRELGDFLIAEYGKKGVDVEGLLRNQKEAIKERYEEEGKTLPSDAELDDMAYEELVADAMSDMFTDPKAYEKLAKLKQKNHNLWKKFGEAIKALLNKLKSALGIYRKGAEVAEEAYYVRGFSADAYEKLQDLYIKAFVKADANYANSVGETHSEVKYALGKGSTIEVNENGEFTVGETKDGTILYNHRTYRDGGRATLKATLEAEGFSEEDIKAALTIIDAKHDLVKRLGKEFSAQDIANKATLITDVKNGHSVLSALVKNGDYPVNIDLLTVCKKRQAYQRVINRLCETGLIEQATLDSLAIAEINKILGKYGFETACLGCFVESKRLRIQEYAQTICDEWNSLVDKKVGKGKAKEFGFARDTFVKDLTEAEIQKLTNEYEKAVTKEGKVNVGTGSYAKKFEKLMDSVPSLQKHLTISDIATPQGMASLKSVSPELFALVASRYGSGSPKPVQDFNPYNSELALYGSKPKDYSSLREYLYAIGGARMQSFSDFIVENWFDYCQIVADLTAKHFPMHTYTKEITLAKLFGMTGIKVNMSLIPDIDRSLGKEYAGLTKNAKGEYELIFADKDRFKASGGKTYMQSINFADAIALQNDPRYSSNVGTIAIGISDNHIRMMLDDSRIRMIIPYHSSAINPIFANLAGIDYYKDYTDVQSTKVEYLLDSKGGKKDISLTKEQKAKLTSGFEFNEVLQRLGDARATAQAYLDWCADASLHTININGETYTAVLTPKFIDFSEHNNYYKLLEDFNTYDSITEQAAPQGDVQQIYPDNFEDILREELTSRENYRSKQDPKWDSAMGEIESYLKKHTKAETKAYAKENGIKFSGRNTKRDSQGNELSAEQQEYFKDSKVRDAEGNLLVVYHGSQSEFTVFKQSKIGAHGNAHGKGFYFTENEGLASSYYKEGGQLLKGYLDIKNPMSEEKVTIKKSALVKYIKAICEEEAKRLVKDDAYGSVREALPDTFISNYVYTYDMSISDAYNEVANIIYSDCDNDIDIIGELYNAGARGVALEKAYEVLGYDGAIYTHPDGVHEFVSFVSSQFKSITNKNPTSDPDIRFSLRGVKPVKPSSDKWQRSRTTDEVKAMFPNLWDVSADESEVRNPTQISGTVKSYRKVYDFLKKSGFKGTILDASSGLGYGTRAGIDEYGFDVEDIEPYPDKSYFPKYTDYSTLDKRYDVIISNAVLNVLPQDQRDALVVKMGELLKVGGRMFINVRGDDVKNATSKEAINEDSMEYYISKSGSYQKGFAKSELVAYLQDALGDGYTVTPTTFFGKTSAVVTKKKENALNLDRTFSYDELIAKDDLIGFTMKASARVPLKNDGSIDGGKIVAEVRKQCKSIQTKKATPTYFINVPDIGRNVEIVEKSITHGFFNSTKSGKKPSPRDLLNAKVSLAMPEILENSIEVNRSERKGNIDVPFAHVMMGTVGIKNDKGITEYYAVRSVIEERINLDPLLVEAEVLGKLHAVNAKKIDSPNLRVAKNSVARGHDEVYSYSIADFLKDVKSEFNDTFSRDVYKNLGEQRKATDFSSNLQYSLRGKGGVSDRTLLANALESVAQNDIEKNKLTQYKKKIALIESEQKKLNEIRAKANELRFTKGRTPAETKTMRELDFEANQIENRISTYDKQLLNLESTTALKNVLEREKAKLRKRLEQKGKESLKKQKEKDAATIRELMTRNTESRKKAIESRHKTEMRHKVIDLLKRLNKLFKGKKESNVKEDMKETVSTALALGEILFNNNISNKDIVNMGVESVTEIESKLLNEYKDILAKKEANLKRIEDIRNGKVDRNKPPYIPDLEKKNRSYDARITKLNKELADVFERERARINKLPVSTLINRLANEYHSLKDSSEEYIKKAYEPELFNKLIDLGKNLGGVTSKDMTIAQLEAVYKAFTMIEHTVRNANKYFRNGKYEDLQASADEIMAQIEKLKDAKQISSGVAAKIKSYIWNELTPYYAFDKIGSQALMAYFNDLMKGQRTVATDANEAKLFAQATREKHGYNKWKLDELYEFKLDDGRTFSTTLKHLLSVYAYSKRAQAQAHMEQGGFFHNDKATFRKEKGVLKMVRTDAESYKINVKTLAEIKKALGDKTAYVDEMLDYLTKMGEKGNEVTRVIWGVDIFTEEIYFPLKSKDDFLKKSTETAQAVSLKNDGMTKETVPNASNPIVLEAFDDVWANHVERMSLYHGLVIPIDNLNKVLHYGTWSETQARTVSTVLEGKFTSAATDYLEQFINDLNGGVTNKGVSNPFMNFFAKFKKTAVGASLSTVVQQPTAIIRAMSEIDAKYFLGSPNITAVMKKWDELKTYAPIAIIKEIGGFDAGGGKQISTWLNSDTLTGIDKVMNTVDEVSMKGAEVADKMGWVAIWEAIKRETKATTNLTEGSQEFFEKCAERFEEVITKTQVYDSTLSRSGFMRSKNDAVKMLTAFMGEPTLSINMIYNAIINAKRGGSKVKAAKTIGCVYIATIAASALASIFYALRDDDEDESYMEKYLQALGGETITDIVLAPITSLPGVKDIVSIFQGWDVERSDMTIFKDLKDAFDGLSSDNKSTYRKVEDFAGAIAAAFGLPVKNILRTGREVYNGFSHAFDDVEGGSASDAFMEGLTGKPTSETSKINKALDSGDTEAARQLISEVVEKKSQKYYEEAQKEAEEKEKPFFKAEALKESESKAKAYVKTSMTSYWKPLYKAAYESGDTAEMTRIRKILYNSGLYGKATDVVKTVGAWLKD